MNTILKTLIFILSTAYFVTAHAGVITNRLTGEEIHLYLSENSVQIERTGFTDKVISYSDINTEASSLQLFDHEIIRDYCYSALPGEAIHGEPDYGMCFFIPILNVPVIVVTAYRVAVLPINLTIKGIKYMSYRKDTKILAKSLATEKRFVVSNKRFKRIAKLLGY